MSLSDYICRDLERRLLTGEVKEEELTLIAIGERYGVSFTPIRKAIDELIDRQLLIRQENGRVTFNSVGIKSASMHASCYQPVAKPLNATDWDDLISREIIRTSLLGTSEFLREESTALQYGLGRTALRQIFHRLSGAGLLTHVPRRGWKVRMFEVKDLDDFLAVREVLECQAIDLAVPRTEKSELVSMLEGNTPGDEQRLDNRLHQYFITRSDNSYIVDFFSRNASYYTRMLDLAAPETQRVEEMAAQHCRVLRCAIDEDWGGAKAAMADHIRAQRPIVLDLIEKLRQGLSLDTRLGQGLSARSTAVNTSP